MKIKEIVERVNRLLSNNSSFKLDYNRLKFYIEGAVDYVNTTLMTEYKTPDEYYMCDPYYNSIVCYLNVTPLVASIVECPDTYYFNLEDHRLYYNGELIIDGPDYIYIYDDTTLHKRLEDDSYIRTYYLFHELPNDNFDYNEIPDRYIRSCIIYFAASLYLEEEDELEDQYRTYRSKAINELDTWKKQYYSMYEIENNYQGGIYE